MKKARIQRLPSADLKPNPPPSSALPRLLDKRGMATLLGFSPRHLSNLMAQGCPHLKFGQRRTRFDAIEVLEWCKTKFGVRRRGPLNPVEPQLKAA